MNTSQLAEIIAPLMTRLHGRADIVFVFGSVATGYDDETAEKNLVTIGAATMEEVEEALAPERHRLPENFVISAFSREDYLQDFLAGKIFIRKSANAPKTFFIGSDADLWDLYYSA